MTADRKRGRPQGIGKARQLVSRVLVTLDAVTIAKGRVIGAGNLSAGLRIAVKAKRVPRPQEG